jgi:kumamolisin
MLIVAKPLTDIVEITLYLHRDTHENGMTIKQYADAVLAGSPDHPVLDHEEFLYQFGATDENLKAVVDWATKNDLTVVEAHTGKSAVHITGTVETFNKLFKITLQDVTDSERTYMKPDIVPTVPIEIASMIEHVPGFDQSLIAKKNVTPPEVLESITNPNYKHVLLSNGTYMVDGASLSDAYNVPAGDGYGECIGILEFTDANGYVTGWRQSDIDSLSNLTGVKIPTPVNVVVDSAPINVNSDVESILDIMCVGTACPSAKIVYYQGINSVPQGLINTMSAAINDTENKPCVLSISWGLFDIPDYDTIMASAVVKGITVFVSSGDYGAENYKPTGCTSPYAVVVGGTSIKLGSTSNIVNEIGSSTSGGGISIGDYGRPKQPVPSWQTGLTATPRTGAGVIGAPIALTGRGTPDLCAPMSAYSASAQYNDAGGCYPVCTQGSIGFSGGTSAAAPIVAAFWARLTALLGQRIPFNPSFFYTNRAQFFRDITTGNNAYPVTSSGYVTVVGWDPITGLGVPNFNAIYQYYHTGYTFPKKNFGFRSTSTSGSVYPRTTNGARHNPV